MPHASTTDTPAPAGKIPAANIPEPLARDPLLAPFRTQIARRRAAVEAMIARLLAGGENRLADVAAGHEYFGVHRESNGAWILREWAPNATAVFLLCPRNNWQEQPGFRFQPCERGVWELRLEPHSLAHEEIYRLSMHWPDGAGERIPAYARRVVQDPHTRIFNAQVWRPETPFQWRHPAPPPPPAPLVYEAHVGMARETPTIGSYDEFRRDVLPDIAAAGYNTIQLMALQEHPYYGSFGYHVSSFFAPSSRFGTPDALKRLVDTAHGLGLRVIMDLIHSHAVRNEVEGLGRYDGTRTQFFHAGTRGIHQAWDSYCFDYGKPEVLHFLLSNCRYWLDEFHLDGFRFDGVTSMLYLHHGLGMAFTSYEQYFDDQVDEAAVTYLTLVNRVIHDVRPDAVTVAEDLSGMPGLAAPIEGGGCGFDYRLAMGVTDMWFKLMDIPDEHWPMSMMWHELTNRRRDERTISYVECHDQAIVGGQTVIFRLMGEAMYDAMHVDSQDLRVERGIALHKMMRLATIATAGHGYLNFMGNEFGHPEWIDFPREGNQWSYHYARRLWSLRDDPRLRYRFLDAFDKAILHLLGNHELWSARPQLFCLDEERKLVAFERNGLYFFLNFHPDRSYEHCAFQTPPGVYTMLLDLDAPDYGGLGRVQPNQTFFAEERVADRERQWQLRLYLPCRSALVLRRQRP